MKTFLTASAAAIAAVTMMGQVALAGPGADLSTTLGEAFTDLLSDYDDASLSNFAVNNASIDGSVDAGAAQVQVLTSTTSNSGILDEIGATASSTQSAILLNQSLGEVKTTAVGALNDGKIKTTSESVDVGLKVDIEAEMASAEADATFASAEAGSLDIAGEFSYAYEGVPDIVATNFAFNSADINGSVTMDGLGAASVATVAAGAVNTGVIEVGIE